MFVGSFSLAAWTPSMKTLGLPFIITDLSRLTLPTTAALAPFMNTVLTGVDMIGEGPGAVESTLSCLAAIMQM